METRYIPSMVLLSVCVAIFASYVALNLAHSVSQAKNRAQLVWLVCGAVAMGVGIWSMHFVGMLAFEMPGMEMAYDVPLMILSVVVAIGASAMTLFIVSRPIVPTSSLLYGGVAMAAAIAGMHYIGMFSMRMAARIEWDVRWVLVSILIALGASFAALWMSVRLRDKPDRLTLMIFASILMGIAISGMHYTGMIAATFIHDDSLEIRESNLLVSSGLSIAVVATTLLLLGIALMGSVGHRIMTLNSKRTKEVLVRSEERFRLLVEAVKDYAIFMLDPDGKITTWNKGAERLTGYGTREAIGQHFKILHSKVDSPVQDELEIARTRGQFDGELLHVRKDGSTFWANAVINPLFNTAGAITGYSKVARDITQIKEAELRMRNLNEELEMRVRERTLELESREAELKAAKLAADIANATKSAFLANMSHEIRTPLGVIIGFSELMLSDGMSVEEKRKNFEIIKRNGRLLSGIINDILDLSKVEAGKLEIEKMDVPLFELVNDTAALLCLEASEKGVRIQVSSDGFVPDLVKTDSMRLRQILFNIIGNAVKFTEKGSVDIIVKLAPEKGASQLAFVVRDSGRGISEEQRERLFSPFTQADVTTTRKFGGTGLGLDLSKKLAKALGGDVILSSSELGRGSTFIVYIDHGQDVDAVTRDQTWQSQSPASPQRAQPLPDISKLRILLVDDSLDNQELVKSLLTIAGADVETASNGREAIAKAQAGPFDVILMDLQMPEMDGHEATRHLREQGYQKPIIALTAHAMKEARKYCLENGFDDHLTKPIDRDKLLKTLSTLPKSQA